MLMDLFGENNDAPYLGIGDVLSMLQAEFPDVTVSKLRFLESKGLVEPERTPSGFRKFRVADVERLRWILRQQKEHFLPLRVIKERLERGEDQGYAEGETLSKDLSLDASKDKEVLREESPSQEPLATAVAAQGPAAKDAAAKEKVVQMDSHRDVPLNVQAPVPAVTPRDQTDPFCLQDEGPTREELCSLTGLKEESLAELEEYGLIAPKVVAGISVYGRRDIQIARSCAVFISKGLEARHLRSYLHAAGRDADLIEQVVTPLLRQRNPRAREAAHETARELAQAGMSLHRAMVLRRLEELLGVEVGPIREEC
jgi:DNA-binding transcriptional MerR regulator